MNNYYQILGIKPQATEQEIKQAYKKLCIKFHPDKNNQDIFFTEKFKEIQQAYEILSNSNKRKKYDQQLEEFLSKIVNRDDIFQDGRKSRKNASSRTNTVMVKKKFFFKKRILFTGLFLFVLSLISTVIFKDEIYSLFDEPIKTVNRSESLRNLRKKAKMYKSKNDIENQILYNTKIVQKNKNDFSVYLELGDLYLEQNNYEKAKENYLEAIYINNQNGLSYYKFALLHYKLENYDETIRMLLKAKDLLITHESVNKLLSKSYNIVALKNYESSNTIKAFEQYRLALKYDRNNFDAYRNLGIYYYDKKKFSKSIKMFNNSLKLNSNQPSITSFLNKIKTQKIINKLNSK